jgi:hypothetical protein
MSNDIEQEINAGLNHIPLKKMGYRCERDMIRGHDSLNEKWNVVLCCDESQNNRATSADAPSVGARHGATTEDDK